MVLYKEFKTVMEMVYVVQKMNHTQQNFSLAEKEEFNKKFVSNMAKCQTNRRFCKEYADYDEAVAQRKIILPPENAHQARLNKILKEITAIDLACQPYQLDNKEIWRKQADTRLKYEKRLDNNLKASLLILNKKEK